jgi:hypothetical protein
MRGAGLIVRFVQRLGNMTQDRPEGVFQLLGGILNSTSSHVVRNYKISDILRLIETWDNQCRGFSEVGIEWQNISRAKQLAHGFIRGQIRTAHQWQTTTMNTSTP